MICRCAGDFSRWPPRIKFIFFVDAKTRKLSQKSFKVYYHIPHYNFLWAQKLKNLESEIIQILQFYGFIIPVN